MGDAMVSTVLPLALAFIMFALGLGLTPADFRRVLARPRAVLLGLGAQMAMIPAVAFALLPLAGLPGELAFGVMILALCPGGVTSNMLTRLAGGDVALSITLTGVASLLAVATAPPLAAVFAAATLGAAGPRIDVAGLALAMVALTTVPAALGLGLRWARPAFAARIAPAADRAAAAVFVAVVAGAVATNWDVAVAWLPVLGPLTLALALVLGAAALALGALGRLGVRERVAVMLEVGIQNGTLGMAVGALATGAATALPPASLPSAVYGLTMYLAAAPAVLLARRWTRGAPA